MSSVEGNEAGAVLLTEVCAHRSVCPEYAWSGLGRAVLALADALNSGDDEAFAKAKANKEFTFLETEVCKSNVARSFLV